MAGESVHMAEGDLNNTKEKRKIMDTAILDTFPKLANGNESVRLDGGMTILRYLHKNCSEEDENTEVKYALKRIIRGLGSSKTVTRKGHYSTLTAFLGLHPEIPIESILSKVDHELKPGDSNSKSETAEIYMGRILAYGAMIRSKFLMKCENHLQLQVMQKLIAAGKQRSYLLFVSVSFIIEYINQVDMDTMKVTVWPCLQEMFQKPWTEYNLDTLYLLLIMRDKFPSLISQKFLKKHLDTEEIISKESIPNAIKVLTDLPRIMSCHHPIFKLVCEKLDSVELMAEFWMHIDKKLEKPSKTDEYLAMELLKYILQNFTDKSVLPSLLSPNFLSYVLKKLPHFKKHHDNEVLLGFKDALTLLVSSVSGPDVKTKIKIGVLKKLMLHPGELMIEKKTGIKVFQPITANMNLEGIKKIAKIFREIVANTLQKEKNNERMEAFWTNVERTYAAQLLTKLLGYSETLSDYEWRLEQLKFLFKYGLCEVPDVGIDLSPQLKDNFYRALDHKLPKLCDLRNILSALVHYLDSSFKSKSLVLRNPLTEEAEKVWNKVIKLIGKLETSGQKTEAVPIFHTMNLHMGLQLFSDAEMAIMSINELESCYERLIKKSKKQKPQAMKEADEPEWVEVVIDLMLSLLSRNNHLLRSLVGCVFPHMCPYITPAAIHQILAVFDVKNEKGPLVAKDDLDDDNEDDEEDDSNEESDSEGDDAEENVENNVTESSAEENDTDDDGESMDEDGDDTVTDRLRQAVRQALGDASVQTDDEDIDVDQIGEEEGKRLDESLAAAFKILRESRRSQPKKQEKSAQTVMHFRVRVIDLLETYLENNPSMAVAIDIVVPLFVLLEYCIKEVHQTPLQHRVRACLKKLSSVKKFKDTEGVDNDVITVILKTLIEKGERTTSVCQEMNDKLAECCIFLVRCAQQANIPTENIVQIYSENLTAFFKKRDCILPPILFKSVLQLHWEGNWKLAPLLVDFAFDSTVRSFRRGHALEFLTTFYNNNRLVHLDTAHKNTRIKLERKLCKKTLNMFNELSSAHKENADDGATNSTSEIRKEVKQRYVCVLLTLLRTVYMRHIPEAWNWEEIGKALSVYRNEVSLARDAKSAYNKLAAQLGISTNVAAKKKQNEQAAKMNGKAISNEAQGKYNKGEIDNTDDEEENSEVENNTEVKKRKKNKGKQKEKQQLKKEARILREKKTSEGFEAFQFSSFSLLEEEMNDTDVHENGDASDTVSSNSHKRRSSQTSDVGSKPKKKKKNIQTA